MERVVADAAAERQHELQRGVPGPARGARRRAPLHTHLARRAQIPGQYARAARLGNRVGAFWLKASRRLAA